MTELPIQYYCPEVTIEFLQRQCPVRDSFLGIMEVEESRIQKDQAEISIGASLFDKDVNDIVGVASGNALEWRTRYKEGLVRNLDRLAQWDRDACLNLFVEPELSEWVVGLMSRYSFLNVHTMRVPSHGATGTFWRFLVFDEAFDLGSKMCYSVDLDEDVICGVEQMDKYSPCRSVFCDPVQDRAVLRELDARLYTPIRAGLFSARNKDVDFNVPEIVARFFDYQNSWQHIHEPKTEYNRPTVCWPLGFGNTWNRYCSDERFLSKVFYYYISRAGAQDMVCFEDSLTEKDPPLLADSRFTIETGNNVHAIPRS